MSITISGPDVSLPYVGNLGDALDGVALFFSHRDAVGKPSVDDLAVAHLADNRDGSRDDGEQAEADDPEQMKVNIHYAKLRQ